MKAARDKAAKGRTLVKEGIDPITEWNKPEAAEMTPFGEVADAFLAARASEWRNEKHKAQWTMTLRDYCRPIRDTPVDAIDTEGVLSVLQAIVETSAGNRLPPSRAHRGGLGRGQGARVHWAQ